MKGPKNRSFKLFYAGKGSIQCSLIQKYKEKEITFVSSISFDVTEAIKNAEHAYIHKLFFELSAN